jgi:hypothetical protein
VLIPVTDNFQLEPASNFPNTSSVRFIDVTAWKDSIVLEEYQIHSVLLGLANLGGAFTVANGVFALIFGRTLMGILNGVQSWSQLVFDVLTVSVKGQNL